MEPINPEPKPGEYVLPWSADDSREFVGASLDPRFDAVSTFALSSKPPRASHPVFGPVPRGFVALTKINRSFPEGRSVVEEKETLFQAAHLSMVQEQNGGTTFWDERYHGTVEVKQHPAEVSRLIAEAQGDGA